jgi:predicted AAA+ superfamily ATPase
LAKSAREAFALQFPKYVVTMDDFWKESIEGIQHFHISDFLLADNPDTPYV